MMKTSIMFSAHAIHVLVRNTLIVLVLLFIALFTWLSLGIRIDEIKIAEYRVEGLYIKLDKRLTLKADKVIIPKRKESPSIDRIDETLERVKHLLTYFDQIDLKEIHFENNVLGINFFNNILQISSKDYLVRGNVHREEKMLIGSIPILQLKKYDLLLRGEFRYDLQEDILHTEGKFLYKDISGFFRAGKNGDAIDFDLSSGAFSDLKSIIDKFHIHPSVKPWIVENIMAKSYQLISLSGRGDVVNKAFKLNIESLRATALLKGVSITFKEGVPPVLARSLILDYSNDKGLGFEFEYPTYLDKNLKGSHVSIVNLRDENTTLHLNLKFDTRFDKEVQKLLHAYGIDVPVVQQSGKVLASFDAKIGLKKPQNTFVADVEFLESNVSVKKLEFPVKKGELHYANNKVMLKNIHLHHPMYEGVLNGTIDLSKKHAKFILDAKNVTYLYKDETLFALKNEKIPFSLGYKERIDIKIPKYTLTLVSDAQSTRVNITDLAKIKAYLSKNIPIEEGGEIKITTKDFKAFAFDGIMKRSSCFIYIDNKSCETRVPVHGTISAKNVLFYAFDERIHYDKKRKRVTLKNINIDLEKFLQVEAKKKNTQSKKHTKSKGSNLIIIGKNSHLRYGEYNLITDSYDVEVKQNGDIKAIGSSDGDIIKFTKVNDTLSLQALRIKDKTLHPLINFKGLQKGRYSLTKKGNPEKVMKGEIIVEGGVMKDFKAYNNTLAFINTLPALATLQSPGYSSEGFTINSGIVEYRMLHRKKIIFDSIYIQGDAANIIGKGEIDLEKKTINVELGIQVARALGNVVGSIPLVGYILVGKDKSLTVGLQITGSLEKPDVSVSTAKDILSYPLELIKRTFEAPGQLLAPTDKTSHKSVQESEK